MLSSTIGAYAISYARLELGERLGELLLAEQRDAVLEVVVRSFCSGVFWSFSAASSCAAQPSQCQLRARALPRRAESASFVVWGLALDLSGFVVRVGWFRGGSLGFCGADAARPAGGCPAMRNLCRWDEAGRA
jgi:hypothetical protein